MAFEAQKKNLNSPSSLYNFQEVIFWLTENAAESSNDDDENDLDSIDFVSGEIFVIVCSSGSYSKGVELIYDILKSVGAHHRRCVYFTETHFSLIDNYSFCQKFPAYNTW